MERFVICRASAGSGKTRTLVRHYIEIAISSPSKLEQRFEHILAITFTNKAANEMKSRIMSQLHSITMGGSNDFVDEMATNLGIDSVEVRRRCSVVQSAILHRYSDFAVCTIDSFVHRLVRTFAHELHLPMNFNVVIDNDDIIQSSVDELLSLAGKVDEEGLTRVLCSFVESNMEDNRGYMLEKQIAELAEQIFTEDAPRFLDKIKDYSFEQFLEIRSKLLEANAKFESQISAQASKAIEACSLHGLGVDDFPYKGTGLYPYFERFANGDFSSIDKPGTRVAKMIEEGVLYAKSASNNTKQAIIAATPDITQAYQAIQKLISIGRVAYNRRKSILANIYGLALLGRLRQIKESYYVANDTVHISEFNKRIAEIVSDEPSPFVYERIGSRYYNYLIDEFQDTSRMQWRNFFPLVNEAMSHDFGSDTAASGCQSLVVGDGKQAIYRFRQGDVRQFLSLPNVDGVTTGNLLPAMTRFDNLDHNYRTLDNIVECNNRFFQWAVQNCFADNKEIQGLYIGNSGNGKPLLWQNPVKKGGYVRFDFVGADDMCADVLETIRHQVDDLGYSYGDIMVLARKKKHLNAIADYLVSYSEDRPIPIVSSESFIISNSRVVMLIVSMMHFLHDTADRVASLKVVQLCSLLGVGGGKINADEAMWLLREKRFNLVDTLSSLGVELDVDLLLSLSLYDCCEQLLRCFHLEGCDSGSVSTLLGVVQGYQQRHRSDINDFLKYIDEKIDTVSSSTASDMNAVNLMTVHKAKGLEQKVVIYYIPVSRPKSSSMWLDVPESDAEGLPVAYVSVKKDNTAFETQFGEEKRLQEMDRLNLMYVAMTRPEQKLIVVCQKTSDTSTDDITLLHRFAEHDEAFVKSDIAYEESERYTIGDDFSVTDKHSSISESDQMTLHNVVFPRWEDRIGIAVQNENLLSPIVDDSRRYGILVHDILSHISTTDDISPTLSRYAENQRLRVEDIEELRRRICNMIESDDNIKFFKPGCRVMCEASLSCDGNVRRPDRIVFADGATWVVDFKTGAYNEKSHKQYLKQVGDYVKAIAAMGYPNVQGKILYL